MRIAGEWWNEMFGLLVTLTEFAFLSVLAEMIPTYLNKHHHLATKERGNFSSYLMGTTSSTRIL